MNKLALIIGNAKYPEAPLKNPVNDANDIQERLDILGFNTILLSDATYKRMDQSVNNFTDKLDDCEVALFFFAGHGMQIEGENYLTAINTNFRAEIDAKHSSLSLNKVIDIMKGGNNQTAIVILDACRSNPYERRWRGIESRGLAPVHAPKGMIIGYATSPGQVAHDGNGENGAYTNAFLKHVSTPDITIEDLFKRVRNTLSSITRGRQISWEHTSLMGDFYFNYSLATDELIPEYSERALADSGFIPSSSNAREIIGELESHNWYRQNPAMKEINQDTLKSFNKDEIFVIGRNIYQAACGTAQKAEDYLENLRPNLERVSGGISYHLLNGMLFEIYFNADGKFRSEAKADRIDDIFLLDKMEEFEDSFNFINHALKPYVKSLFYVPSSSKSICIDVSCYAVEENEKAVEGIFYEGDNILYDETGNEYFDPKAVDYLQELEINEFEKRISELLITPSHQLIINYVHIVDDLKKIFAPYPMNIKRLAR